MLPCASRKETRVRRSGDKRVSMNNAKWRWQLTFPGLHRERPRQNGTPGQNECPPFETKIFVFGLREKFVKMVRFGPFSRGKSVQSCTALPVQYGTDAIQESVGLADANTRFPSDAISNWISESQGSKNFLMTLDAVGIRFSSRWHTRLRVRSSRHALKEPPLAMSPRGLPYVCFRTPDGWEILPNFGGYAVLHSPCLRQPRWWNLIFDIGTSFTSAGHFLHYE